MIEVELEHARGDQPGAERLRIYDGVTGEQVFQVFEANAAEGWYLQYVTDMGRRVRAPNGKGWMVRRVDGPVRIVRLDPDPATVDQRLREAQVKRARRAERMAKGMARA